MDDAIRELYDRHTYEGGVFAFTHPNRLAALARLIGLTTPPPRRSRVLELGCATGENLIPMAAQLPEARFVGIDLSEIQIGLGQETAKALDLRNIELKAANVLDVDRSLGEFDYIIAHGLFSWVPANVREKILAICNENLSPTGVVYISYNVHPQLSMAQYFRELVLLRAGDTHDKAALVAASNQVRDLLGAALAEQKTPYAELFKATLRQIGAASEAMLLHDTLAPVNEAFFFHQFMAQAASHGLQYVGDALPHTTALEQFSPSIRQRIRDTARGSVIEREQWVDMLAAPGLRRTILCHQNQPIDHEIRPERMRDLYVASGARADISAGSTGSVSSDLPAGQVYFSVPHGPSMGTNDPLAKALLRRLMQAFPESIAVEALIAERDRLASPAEPLPTPSPERLCATLAAMLPFGLVEFDVEPAACTNRISERPRAFAPARLQAPRGGRVPTLRHEFASLGPLHRIILPWLDGTRTRGQLLDALTSAMKVVPDENPPSPAEVRASLQQGLDAALSELARIGVLLKD